METTTLEGPITRGRLKKLQAEVHQELGLLKGQEDPIVVFKFLIEVSSKCWKEVRMGEPSEEWESLSPKSKQMMKYMRELGEKLERLGKKHKEGMNFMRKDTQSAMLSKIQDIVELQYYTTLKELVHQATKVEMQLKRRQSFRKPYPIDSERGKKRGSPRKDKSPKKGSELQRGRKEERVLPLLSSSKCLGKGHIASQCPNRRTMIMRENREIESESSQGKSTSSSEIESSSDHSHYQGDLLMVRRLMSNISGDEAKSQRENNFHSRCLVLGTLCSFIIDCENSVNVASSKLVEKLGIPTLPHPKPYKLQ
ncbi:hypothetical protein CR513_08230, partial [Mucuna pruriens]